MKYKKLNIYFLLINKLMSSPFKPKISSDLNIEAKRDRTKSREISSMKKWKFSIFIILNCYIFFKTFIF